MRFVRREGYFTLKVHRGILTFIYDGEFLFRIYIFFFFSLFYFDLFYIYTANINLIYCVCLRRLLSLIVTCALEPTAVIGVRGDR